MSLHIPLIDKRPLSGKPNITSRGNYSRTVSVKTSKLKITQRLPSTPCSAAPFGSHRA